MVRDQIEARGVRDPRVLAALRRVPRHLFVPADRFDEAYADRPLPIGFGQTISQPYIVALMTELVRPRAGDRALDVGSGSGYQAAILAELVDEVCGLEIVPELAGQAATRLEQLGYTNVRVRHADGYGGWPAAAPYQVIVVAAAPAQVPAALVDQLAPGGRMVLPVGRGNQTLRLIRKGADGEVKQLDIAAVAFVPMVFDADR
ncbi:MAG: protein-L-isoaspartate(D-aspartate) O-methyltransferase [Planctomycetaceae bacterium]|nr:MAG: protein-L-isoaspartate(D-aspartate) O-methyltransferase [Planctomycetaceae bacterium]